MLKKRNSTWAGVCSTTKVPRPCWRITRRSAASALMALRAVPWLTPNSAAISNSLGMSWPGFQTPERMRSTSRSRTLAESGRGSGGAEGLIGKHLLPHHVVLYKSKGARMVTKHRRKSSDKGKNVPAPHFLVHSPKDNVGVIVVENLSAGTEMLGVITESDKTIKLEAKESIPIGHKVALKPLKKGDTV